jgi:hypothetical protein
VRRPTSPWAALDWWRAAVEGRRPPIHDSIPECGWFQMRETKGGPIVPVRIELLPTEVNPDTGELEEEEEMIAIVGPDEKRKPASIWTYLTPVRVERYEQLMAMHKASPEMRATKVKLDLSQAPTRAK